MLHRFARVTGIAAVALWLAAAPIQAAEDQAAFTVSDVHVDITAANALEARDKAMAIGQERAYETLMGRLAGGKVPHIDAAEMTDLVSSFEVANERRSTVRYIADYTFHFRPDAVRKLLQQDEVPYAEAPAHAAVVLPVFNSGDRAVLWDDPNPWRDAWADRAASASALPFVFPTGDLPDVQAIDASAAIKGDPAALKAISSRYQNDDVLVAQASLNRDPRRLDVTAVRYPGGDAAGAQTTVITTAARPSESDEALMARAIGDTLQQLEQSWKAENTVDPNRGSTLAAHINSHSLADWVAVRDQLKTIPFVHAGDLVSADRDQLQVTIRYIGNEAQLKAALRDRNLDLTGGDPDWTLSPRGDVAPRPPSTPQSSATQAAPGPLRKADEQP